MAASTASLPGPSRPPDPEANNESRILDLDNHLRKIILGLQGALDDGGEVTEGKGPWTLLPKTKDKLVLQAKGHLSTQKERKYDGYKQSWTPESEWKNSGNYLRNSLSWWASGDGGGQGQHKKGASTTPGGGDRNAEAPSIISKDESLLDKWRNSKWWLPTRKNFLIFFAGLLSGAIILLMLVANTNLELSSDDCSPSLDEELIGGPQDFSNGNVPAQPAETTTQKAVEEEDVGVNYYDDLLFFPYFKDRFEGFEGEQVVRVPGCPVQVSKKPKGCRKLLNITHAASYSGACKDSKPKNGYVYIYSPHINKCLSVFLCPEYTAKYLYKTKKECDSECVDSCDPPPIITNLAEKPPEPERCVKSQYTSPECTVNMFGEVVPGCHNLNSPWTWYYNWTTKQCKMATACPRSWHNFGTFFSRRECLETCNEDDCVECTEDQHCASGSCCSKERCGTCGGQPSA